MAEGRSATNPPRYIYRVDTKINQSDWLRKLIFTGYNLEVTMHVNYSLSMTTSKHKFSKY